jgi:mRNA-degrading endonuclease RelE of RelBE toxin-antitoxin system
LPYKVLISIEILQLERPSRRNRESILSFLESLALNPLRRGDYEELDEVGRPVQIKIIGDYALTFWADHAVKEIKVTKIEKADKM